VTRDRPKPTRPRGRIPRVARLLALAHHFQELLDTGAVEPQAELAEPKHTIHGRLAVAVSAPHHSQ
jgi:hypothetical protein